MKRKTKQRKPDEFEIWRIAAIDLVSYIELQQRTLFAKHNYGEGDGHYIHREFQCRHILEVIYKGLVDRGLSLSGITGRAFKKRKSK